MANKRQLKKRISYVCGDLAGDLILGSHLIDSIDNTTTRKLLTEIAELQEDARAKVSFNFDQAPSAFDSKQAYNKARSKYNAAAFKKLRDDFGKRAMEIVKEMNALIPADVRKTISEN